MREVNADKLYDVLMLIARQTHGGKLHYKINEACPTRPAEQEPADHVAEVGDIPEECFEAYCKPTGADDGRRCNLTIDERERIAAAIRAYHQHLREQVVPTDDELWEAYTNAWTDGDVAPSLRAVYNLAAERAGGVEAKKVIAEQARIIDSLRATWAVVRFDTILRWFEIASSNRTKAIKQARSDLAASGVKVTEGDA